VGALKRARRRCVIVPPATGDIISSPPQAPSGGQSSEQEGRSPLSLLSTEMVRIYKEQFGRGPTKVRSHFLGHDGVICILENTFTAAEKNLQALGEHQRLRDMRTFLQYASTDEFTEAVARVTGRRVRSFISGIDTRSDVACELFMFEPEGVADGDGATRQPISRERA
jgi:uncharacterized protein YbcI